MLTESLLVGGAVRKQKVSAKLPSFRRLLELDKLGVSCFEQVLVKCGAISLKDSRQVNETLHADFWWAQGADLSQLVIFGVHVS